VDRVTLGINRTTMIERSTDATPGNSAKSLEVTRPA
jgi:hypothetical protein